MKKGDDIGNFWKYYFIEKTWRGIDEEPSTMQRYSLYIYQLENYC